MPRIKDSEMKENILGAAAELFLQYGFKKTTVDEIAAKADVGKGSVYLHFKTKDEIFCEIARANAEKGVSQLQTALDSVTGPVQKLRFILRWRPERVYGFREMHNHSNDIMPETKKELMKKIGKGPMKRYAELIEETLKEGKQLGMFNVKSPKQMARHINYMAFAFMPPYRIYETKKEILQEVDKYTDMVIKSMELKVI